MKFRTLSRLIYLKKARHRRGHGIHSPFLFHLITSVIENRSRLPEYKIFRELKFQALRLLEKNPDQAFTKIFHQFHIPFSKPRKLYRKVELPLRYGKVVFRLIREFNPSVVIHYGPSLGVSQTVIALAVNQTPVYQITDNIDYRIFCLKLLKDLIVPFINFLPEDSALPVKPEFIMINYPFDAEMSYKIIMKYLQKPGENDVLIIRGIHESEKMESIWHHTILSENVRVSLDLFEIGIVIFRIGLQKENFIHRF